MNLRAYVGFILLFSHPTSSFAQVGTVEDAIEAAVQEKDPEYVVDLMAQLAIAIKPHVPKDLDRRPVTKLFCYQTMLELMIATFEQATKAAVVAINELRPRRKSTLKVATSSDWFKAVDAAWQASPYKYYPTSFGDEDFDADCWNSAWKAARQALESEREAEKVARKNLRKWAPHPKLSSIAFQGAQWGALNWLLKNIEKLVPKTYDRIAVNYDANVNPFQTVPSSVALYLKHLQVLSEPSLVFLAPILIYLYSDKPTPKKTDPYPGFTLCVPSPEQIALATSLFGVAVPDLFPLY